MHLNSPSPLAEPLHEISTAAASAIDDVRATAPALHPYEWERLGLTQALEAMDQRAGETSQVKFPTDLDNIDSLFPSQTAMHLYRILQESVSNVLKHAQATEAILEVKRQENAVRATLLDNGIGFNDASHAAAGCSGLGWKSMAERVSLLGGTLQIQSKPGCGTRLDVTIPLPSAINE